MSDKDRKSRMEEQIDDNLRRVYAQASEEDVPERFLKLLERLRNQESGQDSGQQTPGDGSGS